MIVLFSCEKYNKSHKITFDSIIELRKLIIPPLKTPIFVLLKGPNLEFIV